MMERADLYVGDKLIRRGRPKSETPKAKKAAAKKTAKAKA